MGNAEINIRVSHKLGEKIKNEPVQEIPMHDNPYLDWSSHVFRAGRTQYILFTNTASLYSFVIYGRGITTVNEFIKRWMSIMRDILEEEGFKLIFKRIIAPATGGYIVGKALNQSVIGSMNDLVKQAKSGLKNKELSPFETSLWLNDIPFSYLDYQKPKEVFSQLEAD